MNDELRYREAAGKLSPLQELARRLAERNGPSEPRALAMAANPGRRLLMLHAAGEAYWPGMDVTRMRPGRGS